MWFDNTVSIKGLPINFLDNGMSADRNVFLVMEYSTLGAYALSSSIMKTAAIVLFCAMSIKSRAICWTTIYLNIKRFHLCHINILLIQL